MIRRNKHCRGRSRRLASAVAAALVAPWLVAASGLADTLTFQEGFGGYTGTVDTFIAEASPTSTRGTWQTVEWDADDPGGSGSENIGLIRFDDIFGANGPSQILPGSQITSATLTYTVNNPGNEGGLYEALVDWDESVTYNGFGGNGTPGVQANERGDLLIAMSGSATTHTVNVTASVAAWSDGTAVNRGWIMIPTGNDGVEFRSREYTVAFAERPLLTVVINEGEPLPELVRQPYLQLGTPTSMTVAWRTDIATDGVLRIGASPGNLDQSYTDPSITTDHAITVDSLQPGARYYYSAGPGAHVLAGGDNDHYFETAPSTGAQTAFTAWIVGDSGTGGATQGLVRDAMLAETAGDPPDIFMHVGDMAYNDGTDVEFTDNFFAPYQDVLRHTVCWPTLGNHEGYSSDSGAQSGPYYEAYILPYNGQAGGLASGTEAYYSFDYANVHFICLDSHDSDRTPGGDMLEWLTMDLAATVQPWIIAFWHHPPYSKGSHDSDNVSDSGGRMRDMRENVLPILEAAGVDLVLTGHSHLYERSFLVDCAYDTPTTGAGHIVDGGDGRPDGDGPYLKAGGAVANAGAVYVVAGHGGAATSGAGGHPLMIMHDLVNGSCLLTIDRNVLSMRNLQNTGLISDYFSLVKGSNTGDCDASGSVDDGDVSALADCMSGPATALGPLGCSCADFDEDGDVDLVDFAAFQEAFTGP